MTWWSALMAKKSSPSNLQQANNTRTQIRETKDKVGNLSKRKHGLMCILKCMHIIHFIHLLLESDLTQDNYCFFRV